MVLKIEGPGWQHLINQGPTWRLPPNEEKQDLPTLVPIAGSQGQSQNQVGDLDEHSSKEHLFDEYLFCSSFWQGNRIYRRAGVRRGRCQGAQERRARHVSRATPRAVFDPTVFRGHELLFSNHVFKFIHIKLSISLLPGDVDLLVARELELGPVEGLNHMLLVLQLGADAHYDLANVDPGPCALGLSKGPVHTCLEPRLGTACQSWMSTGKGCLQGTLG